MIIRSYLSLSEKAINEVLTLEDVCKRYDNLQGSVFLDTSLNFNPHIKSIFLLYKNDKLVSMLSMFIPTQQEAEVSAYTSPEYRYEGYFKALLMKAVAELRKYEIPTILFACESQSSSGKQVIANFNTEYDHTEYFMRAHKDSYEARTGYRLALLKSGAKDLDKLIATSMRTFSDTYEDSKILIENCFRLKNREQYLAVLNDQIIGLGSVNLEGDEGSIFGFGIAPEYRGQGYGTELLHLIVDSLWQRGKTEITLEVNNENTYALKLYMKSGFQIEAAFEYYRKKVSEV
ncbi:MAG: GNAT family N-acetyltransferase [Desulfosporosinus sp.]|nr:GNAT family N-acetyltransferase [Desulfosporosinus sp.]